MAPFILSNPIALRVPKTRKICGSSAGLIDHLEGLHETKASNFTELIYVEITQETLSRLCRKLRCLVMLGPIGAEEFREMMCDSQFFIRYKSIYAVIHEVEEDFALTG